MAEIHTIASETIEQFVIRHPRGCFTNDVATRFGLYITDARRELKRLERQGKITSKRETAGGCGAAFLGAGLVWCSVSSQHRAQGE